MEAASARMAARDRYGAFGEAPTSPLQRFICTEQAIAVWRTCSTDRVTVQACDPQNFEPNLALNLEITDLINQKKGSAYELLPLFRRKWRLTSRQTARGSCVDSALRQPS